MTESNRQKINSFNLFIILFTILSYYSSVVKSELLITEQITTCQPNSPGSHLLIFTSDTNVDVEDNSSFELTNTSGNQKAVRLKKALNIDSFIFNITLDPKTKIQINGTFIKYCENSYTSSCTVIIAFLASLCLILFTALALSLIILRRKKPITFNFGQKEDRDYDRKQFSDNSYEENYEQTNKESIDVTNSNLMNAKNSSKDSPRTSLPRKSSLKPPKSNFSDQLNNNSSSHENAAYTGGDLEVVDELNEDKVVEEIPDIKDTRRKSIVTFSDTTQVNYG